MRAESGAIVQALMEHRHLRHFQTVEDFRTCACTCGILTECAGQFSVFDCYRGHAEHLARDVLAPITPHGSTDGGV